MLVKVTNGVPAKYTLFQLRKENPQVSFPENPADDTLAAYNVFPLVEVDPPTPSATEKLVEGTPTLINGKWTQTWNVVDATAEINAAKDAQVLGQVDVLFGKVLFEVINDVRVLKGQGTINRNQFITYLRSKL